MTMRLSVKGADSCVSSTNSSMFMSQLVNIGQTVRRQDKDDRGAAKVIFLGGEIQSFSEPITVAELMLETTNSFLVNSKSLQIGRRFSPLNADEDLKTGNVYVLFPKQRLYSVVNTGDMGALFLAAKRGSSTGSKSKRVDDRQESSSKSSSQAAQASSVSKSNLEEIEEFFSPEMKRRLSLRRSKKPLLETIVE
ncbi:hypothetical protein Cgig2_003266 [Carnegiea gigantea]|uniref:Uncharacterized protein n=1 Tax=Carnegiea gigantea TaxID=171969 RepID=A0A9Q1GS49_9CARY|nr:hypothetical protein Cgig2_003266 [Carnegiea gigantea]